MFRDKKSRGGILSIYEKNPGYKTHVDRQRVMFGYEAIAELLGLTIWGAFIGRMWEEKRAFSSNLKPGDRGIALVHIFRFEAGRIAELWDIGQPVPENSPMSLASTSSAANRAARCAACAALSR